MRTFILHWVTGKKETVEGTDVADACRRAGIGAGALPALNYYEEQGAKTQVAGIASCGCVYHAEEGLACPDDLEQAKLLPPTHTSGLNENWEDQIRADRKRDTDEIDAKIEKEFGRED